MAYYLAKIVGWFVSPYNLAIVALAISLWCLRKGRPRATGSMVVSALVLLVVPGMPIVAESLLWDLETAYPARLAARYPTADAIVVLGGTVGSVVAPRLEAQEDGSRLLAAARLYRARRARTIVLTGGVPYTGADGRERTEADDMREILLAMAVPDKAMLLERASRNTLENAELTARLLKKEGLLKKGGRRSVLLVTSAFHMRRAVDAFRKQDLEVVPVPASFMIGQTRPGFRRWSPTAGSLNQSSSALREHAGYLANQVLSRNP